MIRWVGSAILVTASVASLVLPGPTVDALDVPDISGTYDVATLTPLRRPAHFGDNLYLTPDQAGTLAASDRQRDLNDSRVSDPDREAPPEGGDGSAGAAGNVGGYNTFWIDNGDQAFTLNGKFRTSIITYPENGRTPALTPKGAERAKARAQRRRENTGTAWWLSEAGPGPYDNPEMRPLAERCLLGFGPVAGPPMVPALYNNVKRIVQTDKYIMIMAEMVHDARVVRLNEVHRPDSVRTWLGDSIGHWEDKTLVVETTNFKSQPALYGADENLKVTEWFTRLDDDTLHYRFEVEDPTVWQDVWRGDYPWPATKEKLFEYACHEGNYALGNIMRGARLLEQDIEGPRSAGD